MLNNIKFFLEKSPIKIYQRIIENIKLSLNDFGCIASIFNPEDFRNINDYASFINSNNFDYCIISNSDSLFLSYCPEADSFLFEKVNSSLIFIHHDNPFSKYARLEDIHSIISAYLATRSKSFHFFIEYSNFIDFKCLGINNSFHIYHSSEFTPFNERSFLEKLDISFVGHVLPGNDQGLNQLSYSHFLKRDYWKRVVSLDQGSEESSLLFATEICDDIKDKVKLYSLKFFYRAILHKLSIPFRGEIISRINKNINVSIFGGDPSYISGDERKLIMQNENISYFPCTNDYRFSNQIYSKSKINLNITSLQFDTAVINRVIDIGASGGFVLTDWKSDLSKITSVSEEISYKTIEELNHKIEYYLAHEKARQDVAFEFCSDIVSKCSYTNLINYILSQINPMKSDQTAYLRIDLGCGPSKPDGFIGVDIGFQPGVDIIADLNRCFPFADDSVDIVRAHDTVEHLHDRLHTMNEIWRVCKHGALVEILVPSTDGRGAFQDPTHVSYWNINSFRYYCVEFPAYLSLCQKYGFKGQFSLDSLENIESEDQVIHVLAKLKAIKKSESPTWIQDIDLRAFNILVVIDWRQAEDLLTKKLSDFFKLASTCNDLDKLGILFYLNGQVTLENVQAIIYGVIMDLYLQETIEDPECFHISCVQEIFDERSELLFPYLLGRISIDNICLPNVLDMLPVKASISDVFSA